MKQTSLSTSNTDAIATSVTSVSENICVQFSVPKKPHHQNTQWPPPKSQKKDTRVLPHTKRFEVPEEFKPFLKDNSGTEDSEIIWIFD